MKVNNRYMWIVLLMVTGLSPLQAQPEIITVGKDERSHAMSVSATVVPYREITFTAQAPGRVAYIAGEEGTMVGHGQIILALDDEKLVAQRRSAEAQLYHSYTLIENSQVQYRRELYSPIATSQRPMAGMGMPAMMDRFMFQNIYGNPVFDREVDLYARHTEMNKAQTAYVQAQAELSNINAQLRDMRSIAPFSGVMVRKHVEVGDTVQPGQPLITFAMTERLQLKAEIPVRFVANIQQDQILDAELDNKAQIQVRVAHVYPQADEQRHTVTVKFDLPHMMYLATGMYAKVFIPVQSNGGFEQVVIPETALLKTGSLPRVLVVNQSNTTELRVLRIGKIHNDGRVSILSGLYQGERIINNPPAGVRSGWMPN